MEINKKGKGSGLQQFTKSKKTPTSLSSNNIDELVDVWVGICMARISFDTEQN